MLRMTCPKCGLKYKSKSGLLRCPRCPAPTKEEVERAIRRSIAKGVINGGFGKHHTPLTFEQLRPYYEMRFS